MFVWFRLVERMTWASFGWFYVFVMIKEKSLTVDHNLPV